MTDIDGTPAATADALADLLGVAVDDPEEGPRVTRAWGTAVALLDFELIHQFRPIEADVLDGLRLEVGQEAYKRLDAPAGGSQFVSMDGAAQVRAPRDPLNRSYPVLDMYRVAL